MAECVSCGKEIPQGKFFCDACYVKMKGRRGALKGVPRVSAERPQPTSKKEEISAETVAPQEPTVPAEVMQEKKASGQLTPASSKNVVSMKPSSDKAAREKSGKKRFTVTITFSERTYAALARLKRRKDEGTMTAEGEAGEAPALPSRSRASHGKRLHGRPKLKAVAGASGTAVQQRGGFMRMIEHRDRASDRRDLIAIAMTAFATLVILILSFLPWARVSWSQGEGASMQTAKVAGVDLGALTYICIALAVGALLYMVATWIFPGPLDKVDYGVVFIVAGVLFIPIFYVTIASNARFLSAALEQAGGSGSPIPGQFERQTLWPAYVMVFAGALLAFAGLVRMSERKSKISGEDKSTRGAGQLA